MFNPTSLQLKPSIPLAIIFSIPFFCAGLLFAVADIPAPLTLLLLVLASLGGYYFVSRYALLSFQSSICLLESHSSQLFIHQQSGRRFVASLAPGAIIHPWLCILTFNCAPAADTESLADIEENRGASVLIKKFTAPIIKHLSHQTRRHVIICRYNATSLNEYRRLRVVLTFS